MSDSEIRKLMEDFEREWLMERLKSFPINKEEFIKNITPEMNNIVFPCYVGISSPPERDMQEINDCYSKAAYQRAEKLRPRPDGKQICKYLRQLRAELAQANNIPFESRECTVLAPCAGTCEQCDAEAAYLNEKMQEMAEDVRVYPKQILKK